MSCATSRPRPGPGRAGFELYTFALPLPSWLITGRIPLSPRRNSADSTAGSHASTLVGHTCGWDPRGGRYRAATGHHKTCVDTWNFSKCLVEHKIAPGAPQSCQTACRYHGQYGGKSCAASRPGPGPGRAGFQLYTFALPLPAWLITGRIPLSPRRNSADWTAGSHASTLVGHTCGWDPRGGRYRAATGHYKTCVDT